MDFRIDGMQHVQKKLDDLSGRIKQLEGSHNVPMSEVLTPEFISGCSKFYSLAELLSGSGFTIESQEDFKAIPDDEWDSFIKYYPAPYEQVKEFLAKKEYENITVLSFKQGRVKGIAPWMLTYYYVIKKGRLNNYEAAIKPVIMSLRMNKRDALNYLEPCILLSDSLDDALRNKCQQIIAIAYSMNFPEIRARDYLKNFKYHRFKLVWFKSFVGSYLNTAKPN